MDIAKKEGKEQRDIKMDVRKMSVNKNVAKKSFVAKASDDHTSETHVTGVYNPHILPHAMAVCTPPAPPILLGEVEPPTKFSKQRG